MICNNKPIFYINEAPIELSNGDITGIKYLWGYTFNIANDKTKDDVHNAVSLAIEKLKIKTNSNDALASSYSNGFVASELVGIIQNVQEFSTELIYDGSGPIDISVIDKYDKEPHIYSNVFMSAGFRCPSYKGPVNFIVATMINNKLCVTEAFIKDYNDFQQIDVSHLTIFQRIKFKIKSLLFNVKPIDVALLYDINSQKFVQPINCDDWRYHHLYIND